MLAVFPRLNVLISCFKKLPLNFTYILMPVYLSVGASVFQGGFITSSDNPLDLRSEILSAVLIFLKYLYIG